MNSHQNIDERALRLAEHIVEHIDADPERRGLAKARTTCHRWQTLLKGRGKACVDEWAIILEKPWDEVRRILLATDAEATRLRQNNPFCGILSNTERWKIIKECKSRDTRAA